MRSSSVPSSSTGSLGGVLYSASEEPERSKGAAASGIGILAQSATSSRPEGNSSEDGCLDLLGDA